jgi:GTP-binding protein
LFNRIVGKRIAIVHDEPGVTRDRISAEAEWHGRPFTLVDTGGIGLLRGEKTGDMLAQAAYAQVQIAIEAAQVVVLVVNIQEGLMPLDREVAMRLRTAGKTVLVAVNKTDKADVESEATEFAALGFPMVIPVSAIHGRGIDALMDAAMKHLPKEARVQPASDAAPQAKTWPEGPLKIAIVGRPNVGKSSLTNALTHSERVIVSPIPGTTRDAVDVPFEVECDGVKQNYILIDTAGLRKRRHVDDSIEFYSVTRAEESVRRSDIVVFMLDAESGIMEQDKKIADLIVTEKKACVVVVNKWDLVSEEVNQLRQKELQRRKGPRSREGAPERLTTLAEFAEWVQGAMFYLDYAPVIFASAKEGYHLDRLLEAIRYVAAQLCQRVPTALLNRVIQEAIEARQPVSDQGHFLKLFYATQKEIAPPTFLLFVNRKEVFSPPYAKYLAGVLRKNFGYEGCPIVFDARPRPRTVVPKRSKSKPMEKGGRGRFRPENQRD